MKLFNRNTIILLLLISTYSCEDVKSSNKIKSYKISGLKSNFSLPERFENISGEDLISKIEEVTFIPSDITKEKMIKKQVHFIDNENEELIMIASSPERLQIEKLFLNQFADFIEEETLKKSGKDYELIEKKFFTSRNKNNAFKVKFKYESEFGNRFFTTYFLTTKNESLVVHLYNSLGSYDLQDMITIYMNKN